MIAKPKRYLPFAAFAIFMATGFSASAQTAPTGLWYDHTGRGAVEITRCGQSLCGHLVWLKDAGDNEVCGRQIIGDVRPVAGGKWDNGWIYDPEKDAKYDVELTLLGSGKLKVLGYAGTKLFSETMIWQRAPDNLKKCNQDQATMAAPVAAPQAIPQTAIPQTEATAEAPAIAPPAVRDTAKLATNDARAPVAKAAPKDCKLRFASIEVTFPCID
jgi:uncharacterized protein (DUF2147 family)